MTSSRPVQSYFDAVATGYNGASGGWLWRGIRSRETAAFLDVLGPVSGKDVLELGCGAGFYTRQLLAHGARHVWAVDFSAPMLAELPKEHVTAIHGDAALVDPHRTFDLIASAGMLEFVPDALAVLRNAARLANPGGTLALLYPTDTVIGRGYRRFHRRNGMEIRLFSRATLEDLAVHSGWTIASTRAAGPFSAAARLTRIA